MRALIIGGAACVWDDLARAEQLADFDALLAVNDAGTVYPGVIDAWVTLHPEHLSRWTTARADNGHPPARRIVAHKDNTQQGRACAFPVETWLYRWPGSSGLFAAQVALEMLEASHVVACGVPMLPAERHFFDAAPWDSAGGFWPGWEAAYPHIKDRVRSMSGRTMDLLGAPTPDWLSDPAGDAGAAKETPDGPQGTARLAG